LGVWWGLTFLLERLLVKMDNQFTTQDIYLAASAIALGAQLDDIDARDKRHQRFILTGYDIDFVALSRSYYAKELQVEATAYREALRQLKSAIHLVD
jgi:hypothetical protein